jgi:hypothetical protein
VAAASRAFSRHVGLDPDVDRPPVEAMRLEPGRHRFERVTRVELGGGRCGAWQVRLRLGLLGMLTGWWELKLSSGCPLPRPPAAAP